MTLKHLLLASALVLPADAGTPAVPETTEPSVGFQEGFVPAFDALVTGFEMQGTFDFDSSSAELDSSRFSFVSFLSKPLPIGGHWRLLPVLDYGLTSLDFGKTPAGFPLEDADLHKIGLSSAVYHAAPGQRWLYGAWGRASFASDTQHIDHNDFYYDAALGAGYLVTNRFLLGAGAAILEIGGDESFVAGPGFYWKPTSELDLSLIGVLFNTTWRPSDDWSMALRFRPFGNSWNIDNGGFSQQLDLNAYTLRIHAERRIYRDIWLSLGVGYAFADDIELRTNSDRRIYKDDLDGGLSTAIGLRIRTW